jgi:hypothetical protein
MATKTLGKKGGELVQSFESFDYCFVSGTLDNTHSAAITLDPVGQIVKLVSTQWSFVLAADAANVIGLVVQGPKINELASSAETTDKYLILALGPAVVNEDVIATTDIAGSAITLATVKTALGALAPKILFVADPAKTTEGTD